MRAAQVRLGNDNPIVGQDEIANNLAQLSMLAYNPGLFIPTQQAAAEATALVDRLKKIDGPVWFAAYPSYAALAGKPWVTQYGTLLEHRTV